MQRKTLFKATLWIAGGFVARYVLFPKSNKEVGQRQPSRSVERVVENEPLVDESMFGDLPYNSKQDYLESRA